jgi:hypothetical protein
MSPSPIKFFLGAATMALTAGLLAAQDSPPTPGKPVVDFPRGEVKFVILVKPGEEASTAAVTNGLRTLSQVEITGTGETEKRVNTWSNGKTTEDWCIRDYIIAENPYGKWLNIYPPGTPGYPPYPAREADFGKISADNYKGIDQHEGQKCYLYEIEKNPENIPGAPNEGNTRKSYWISVNSLLPVAFEYKGSLYTYHFLAASPEPLELPLKYQHEWDQFRACNPGIAP